MTRQKALPNRSSTVECLAIALLVAVVCTGNSEGSSQVEGSRENISFSVTGRRNTTGHWIVNVVTWQREGAASGGWAVAGPWRLDVIARALRAPGDGGEQALQLEVQLTVAPRPAQPGYEVRQELGSRYKLHTRAVPWLEAQRTCVSEGAHLAVVNSEAEAALLNRMFARHPKILNTTWDGAAWLVFHDRFVEGEYITVLDGGLEESGFTDWFKGQPDNFDHKMPPDVDSDCGALRRTAQFDDLPCSARYAFLCEQEL